MKVAIDVSPLKSGHKFRGVGVYTERLVEALSREAGSRSAGQSIKVLNFSLQLIEEGKIPQDADLVHYPFFDPFFLTLPLKKLKPAIVTIHDITPLVFPDRFPRGVRGWAKFQIQKFSLRKIAAVITDSETSKTDIERYLDVFEEKVFVVPLAPGEEFKPIKSTKLLNSIKVKYNLPEKFVLYVGDVNWNKNLEGLIKAMSNVKCQMSNVKLVLVGKAFEDKKLKETRLILQLIKQLSLINQTKILGYVPTQDLVAIYNLATVYCQPSFYEGFGLPVLEAMACGCPVVAAKTSSLPEICGEAAIMVSPNNINNIARGLEESLSQQAIRDKLIQAGLSQAKKFTWQKTAKQTINVYQKVLAKLSRGC